MLLKTIWLLSLSVIILNAELIVVHDGKTYDFAEKNAIDDIQDHITKNKNKIESNITRIADEQKSKIKEYRPKQKELTPAKKNNTYYPNMTYTLKEDILDANGKAIYKKGFKFNPADYIKLNQELIVVNIEIPEQKQWLIDNEYLNNIKYMILLDKGNAFDLAEEYQRPIYYITEEIAERFNINHTPTIVTQIKNQIKVSEICLKDCI